MPKKFFNFLKDIFVPSERNGHKPSIFRHDAVVAIIVTVLFIESVLLVQELVVFKRSNFIAAVLPGIVASLTNDVRAEDNLGPLSTNQLLTSAAQKKANDMASRGYFAHVSPEGNPPWYWLDKVGYDYRYAGENLAVNFTDSKELLDGWMASPAHRANILKKDFTEIGIGMATGTYQGRESIFVVEFFGSRSPARSKVAQSSTVKSVVEVVSSTSLAKVSPDTPVVFGTSTAGTYADSSGVGELMSSPRTLTNNLLLGLAVTLLGLILLGVFMHFRFPHPTVMAGGFSIAIVILMILFFNSELLFSPAKFPTDTQSASVVRALK
ncbi:MAG: CAP domain-containing protein [Candidatus Paceibacterota bacterium]|jgi:hypothetical protein